MSTIKDDEYIGEDGLLYCKNCNTLRVTKKLYFGKHMPIVCKCKKEKQLKEEEEYKLKEKIRRIEKLKETSLLGKKYENVSFDNTETGHNEKFYKAYTRCKKYCEIAPKVLTKGIGIYMFGDKGTGKSRLTACMANELMNNYYTVLYTNFSEISKYIRKTYGSGKDNEMDLLNRLTDVDFLFIDDFGTEIVTKNNQDLWLQEKVFEVINKRYNENKPIIFTSNYSLRELIENRGVADKTIDRINEICEVIKIDGTSYRKVIKEKREELF